MLSAAVRSKAVILLLFIHCLLLLPFVCGGVCAGSSFDALSNSAIILLRKIELTDLLKWCHLLSLSLFLANPWVGLWYVIVALTCKNF